MIILKVIVVLIVAAWTVIHHVKFPSSGMKVYANIFLHYITVIWLILSIELGLYRDINDYKVKLSVIKTMRKS